MLLNLCNAELKSLKDGLEFATNRYHCVLKEYVDKKDYEAANILASYLTACYSVLEKADRLNKKWCK